MTSPWKDEDWFPPRAYQEQLARTARLYRRVLQRTVPLRRPDGELTDIEERMAQYSDDVWSFFINAWHVRDWVQNDDSIEQVARARIVRAAEDSRALCLCADLANGRKHLALRTRRIGAELSSVRAGWTTASKDWLLELYLTLGDDDRERLVSAVTIAFDGMREWQRIIESEGLPMPKGFPDLSVAPNVREPICDTPTKGRGD